MLRREVLSLATALVFLLPSGRVSAQETPDAAAAAEERTEEIVVTGTRIRRKDLTTPAPVTVISRDQIAASGKATIGDFLQALPQQGNAINTQFNNGGNGATRVNLRLLGTQRTLTLINGRRVVPGGVGADAAVDLNSIPTQAIESIEILQDGASAVYGSDAIAGVVNIITRKNLAGSTVAAYAGTSSQGDGTVYDVSLSAGASSEKGNILFSVGYFNQQEIWAGDRDYSKTDYSYDYASDTASATGSSAVPNGRFRLNILDPNCNTAKCAELRAAFPTVTGSTNWIRDPTAPTGFRRYGFDLSGNPVNDTYNYQPENYLSTPQERVSAFAIGDTRLGDSMRAFFEASYVNRQSSQKLAPEPLFTISSGLAVTDSSFYNPFNVSLPDTRRRLVEFGNRNFSQNVDTFRAVAGLDGTLPETLGPLSGWFWDLAINYGRTTGLDVTKGTLRAPLVGAAIGPSFFDPTDSVVKCGAPGAVVSGCTPLNLLGGAGTISPDQVLGLGFDGADRGTNQMLSYAANMSGDLFSLGGAGPVALAVGAEYRELSGSSIPNPISAAGENTGNNFLPTAGSYDVRELYGELSIPLLANLPGVQSLEATVAARYFDYSSFGSDVTYKIGALWQPIPDVKLRGTYSTAFRAPDISDLFSGQFDDFPTANDPCSGNPDPTNPAWIDPASPLGIACGLAVNNGDDRSQLNTIGGGNPDLTPETAKIFTVGAVFTPRFVKNLSVTLDYYSIDLTDSIEQLGPGTILNGCYSGGGQYCNLITRDPATQLIVNLNDTLQNVGGDKTAGLDWAARYDVATGFGRFRLGLDGTYLQKFDRTLADGTVVEAAGNYDLFAAPKWKFNTGVTWGWKGFGAGLFNRYIGSFEECANDLGGEGSDGLCYIDQTANLGVPKLARKVDAWNQLDAFVSYAMTTGVGRTNVTLGMKNVFDDNPRIVFNGFLASSDAATYDYIGRYVYLRLEHSY